MHESPFYTNNHKAIISHKEKQEQTHKAEKQSIINSSPKIII